MIHTSKKPIEELLSALDGISKIFIVACGGCPVGAETGNEADVTALENSLKEKGKTVTGTLSVDFLCNKILTGTRLLRNQEKMEGVQAVVVSACGIGVQATAKLVDVFVVPALNTVSLGGLQGLYPASERCGECGDCVLHLTAGICPITGCAKHLLNGPCGGSQRGMC
ncbi:MAG: methylenetetrahydrofolate reductase C-terminal domain-containing protein, partial [Planctomycetota bacterium]|nr:methylenetetrahydrofolate reductase C-terminal domain-containing protein [Planctomycetota bacterium]